MPIKAYNFQFLVMKKLVLIFLFLGLAFAQAANTDIQKQFEASKYMYSTFAKLEKQILSLPSKESFSTKKLDSKSYGLHFKVEVGDVYFPTKDFWCSDTLEEWCNKYIERMRTAFFIPYTLSVELKKNIGKCPAGTIHEKTILVNADKATSVDTPLRLMKDRIFRDEGFSSNNEIYECWAVIEIGHQNEPIIQKTPRKETLYLSGQQWATPQSFNPLAESWMVSWPVGGRFNLMYEPLITYNTLNGALEPLLGTLVPELSNNDSIVVDLNPAARWSDGKPVNSNDVKYIFTKGSVSTVEQIADIHVDTLYEASADTTAPKKMKGERLSFMVAKDKRNNPLSVMDLLQAIRIVPSHVFAELEKQNKGDLYEVKKLMLDKNPLDGKPPVVSGPYNLMSYDSSRITLKRRDDYWGNNALHHGKRPAPKYIVHPILRTNYDLFSSIRDNAVDVTMGYISHFSRMQSFGIRSWFDSIPYHYPATILMLIINVTKPPLDNAVFRRAMATAIEYGSINQFALYNQASDIEPGLVIPYGLEKKYAQKSHMGLYGIKTSFDDYKKRKDKVQEMLNSIGIQSIWNYDGTLSHMGWHGERIPTIKITSHKGWTDWETIVSIAVNGLRWAGIDVQENFVDGGQYWHAMGLGNFDLIMHKPAADVSPSLPWSRFNEVMSSQNWQPLGAWASANIGRYNNPASSNYRPEVDSLLKIIPLLKNEQDRIDAYEKLNMIFMVDQPAIPLVYLPEQFYYFNDKIWKNWPTQKNPYAPPQIPGLGSGTNILWHIYSK